MAFDQALSDRAHALTRDEEVRDEEVRDAGHPLELGLSPAPADYPDQLTASRASTMPSP